MKVRFTIEVDDDTRRAIAWLLDNALPSGYNGKRKAARDEIIGCVMAGGEESLSVVGMDYDNWKQRVSHA